MLENVLHWGGKKTKQNKTTKTNEGVAFIYSEMRTVYFLMNALKTKFAGQNLIYFTRINITTFH